MNIQPVVDNVPVGGNGPVAEMVEVRGPVNIQEEARPRPNDEGDPLLGNQQQPVIRCQIL